MSNKAVLMSVYFKDEPLHVKLALDSMLYQSVPLDILVYVDGVVPDKLRRLLALYESEYNITVFFNEKNVGLAKALNFLVEYSLSLDYEFLIRMDSDDISRLDRVEKQLNFFTQNPEVSVVGAGCREFGSSFSLSKKILPQEHSALKKMSITHCPFVHPTVVFRKEVFELGLRYPVDTAFTEDMALWFKLLKADLKFGNVPEVLLDYRMTESTVKRRQGWAKGYSEYKLRLKYMLILDSFSFRNFALIFARLLFHIVPAPIMKLIYRRRKFVA
ncbi:glycosyltransferase [Vibrio breoganii]